MTYATIISFAQCRWCRFRFSGILRGVDW